MATALSGSIATTNASQIDSNHDSATSPPHPTGDITPLQKALSAISGAIMTSLMVTPLDVVKTRLQSQPLNQPDIICCREPINVHAQQHARTQQQYSYNSVQRIARYHVSGGGGGTLATATAAGCSPSPEICLAEETSLKRFSGTWEGLVKIARNEGLSSLWRGLSPTLFMAVPSTVIYFVGYEQLRLIVNTDASWAPLLCGALARTASATAISPLELLRTRLQSATHTHRSASETFTDVTQGIRQQVRTDGLRVLWRGLSLTLWRDVPFSGLYWLGYERTKRQLQQSSVVIQQSPFLQSFLAGGISGTFAALITTPFDVAKTKKQIVEKSITSANAAEGSMVQIMRRITVEEGWRGLWRGTVPRCLKVSPACAIMISSYEFGKRFFGQQQGMA
ncbi:mitochondrial carrier domain-containing protein [Protomyces lactucae-debilis]|uniref:Mitochondrial carrier domain-containing protein n=1 Tax=Protomyces lactucae-debilis TaxID=2754530 RepID=A0A1Y2FVT8_PROLT|nr:mitochondrial carrier domain-containing protein [Protomyces lactucae-debilis]ORY86795.1 mitochondrial carrier domain-containing protein [Protomyces lactucae-debilis]